MIDVQVIETREDNYQVKKQAEEVGDGRKYKPIYIYYIFIHIYIYISHITYRHIYQTYGKVGCMCTDRC